MIILTLAEIAIILIVFWFAHTLGKWKGVRIGRKGASD
jgi:hypothetical protein